MFEGGGRVGGEGVGARIAQLVVCWALCPV